MGSKGANEHATEAAFAIEDGSEERIVRVRGRIALTDADRLRTEVLAAARGRVAPLVIALGGSEVIDGGAAAVLIDVIDELRASGRTVALSGASENTDALVALYGSGPASGRARVRARRIGFLDEIGRATASFWRAGVAELAFVGDLAASLARLARRPGEVRWKDLPALAERAGADGVPITLLINFLVGLIIALQSAFQMQRFGAEIFVADLVGLAVARELGPLMTAILVAGRSGAAYAAELGTMRVNEEVDALEAMRIDPLAQLVVPRVLALVCVVPFLTLLGDLVGIAGGLIVAVLALGIDWQTFVNRASEAVGFSDVLVGVMKSIAFAAAIALIACQRGLATRGGATGVGQSTTAAVVTILFALIILDALFTAFFHLIGV